MNRKNICTQLCAGLIVSSLFGINCAALDYKRVNAPVDHYNYDIVRYDHNKTEESIEKEIKYNEIVLEIIENNVSKIINDTLEDINKAKENALKEPKMKKIYAIENSAPEVVAITNNKSEYIYYDVALSDELQEYTQDLCKQYGINHKIALGIMYVESRFQPDVVSKTADHGIMQINECNHDDYEKKLGITDFLDAKQGILAGIYMLYDLKTNYGCDTEDKMIMSYPGVGNAWKLWEKGIYTNWYVKAVRNAMSLLQVRE